jgi:hypothetical protein
VPITTTKNCKEINNEQMHKNNIKIYKRQLSAIVIDPILKNSK